MGILSLKAEIPFAKRFDNRKVNKNEENNKTTKNFQKRPKKVLVFKQNEEKPIEYESIKGYKERLEKASEVDRLVLKKTDGRNIFRRYNPPNKVDDFANAFSELNPI